MSYRTLPDDSDDDISNIEEKTDSDMIKAVEKLSIST
jgi:hypothetical protein